MQTDEDDERVAAFLEGRLKGPERERVRAHLLGGDDEWGMPGLRAIRGEPLRARFTAAMATAAARMRRWVGLPLDGGDRAALAGKHLSMDGDEGDAPALACPASRVASWNPNDAENGYCAAPTCHRYLHVDEVLDVRERPN